MDKTEKCYLPTTWQLSRMYLSPMPDTITPSPQAPLSQPPLLDQSERQRAQTGVLESLS